MTTIDPTLAALVERCAATRDAAARVTTAVVEAIQTLKTLESDAVAIAVDHENLRGENKALHTSNDAAIQESAEARAHTAKLTEELDAVRAERKHVRGRIEKLLTHIDQLSAG